MLLLGHSSESCFLIYYKLVNNSVFSLSISYTLELFKVHIKETLLRSCFQLHFLFRTDYHRSGVLKTQSHQNTNKLYYKPIFKKITFGPYLLPAMALFSVQYTTKLLESYFNLRRNI